MLALGGLAGSTVAIHHAAAAGWACGTCAGAEPSRSVCVGALRSSCGIASVAIVRGAQL